ncbi:hypothetical protein TWF281_002388 [Arthrobotrys megalospora]
MHFSTLTGACLLALSALVNNANAYAYGSSVATTPTPIAGGTGSTPSPRPGQYSTSVYTAVNGSVRTIQTCTIEFCAVQPAHVATSVATVQKPVTTTITRTATGAYYVTKKDQTRTLTKTTTKSYTSTVQANVKTVYSTRVVKVTSVRTVATVKTVTAGPANGGTKSTVVIPTPKGFVYASQDPANDESNFPTSDAQYIQRRDYGAPYPKSVKCTKTLQTTSTRTYTIDSRSTSTVYGYTSTVTYTKAVTTTVTPAARTTTITRATTSTVISTSTKTSYTTVTKPNTPVATSYAACNSANIFNGPTGSVGAQLGDDSVEIRGVSTPQECCAKCQCHVNSAGVKDCVGSFFGTTNGQSTCMLKVSNTCDNGKNVGMFVAYPDDEEFVGYVSNGPCGRWNVMPDASYAARA